MEHDESDLACECKDCEEAMEAYLASEREYERASGCRAHEWETE